MDIKYKIDRRWVTPFFLIGSLFLLSALYLIASDYLKLRNGVRVTAVVADFYVYETTDDNHSQVKSYSTIFKYEVQGKAYFHQNTLSTRSPDYEIGEKVSIWVNPLQADDVVIDSFRDRWKSPLLLFFASLFNFGMSLLARRKSNSDPDWSNDTEVLSKNPK